MQMFRPPMPNPSWCTAMFGAKSALRGGVIRRAVRDVEHEIGRDAFMHEARARGFHLVECGGQFIVICNDGQIKVHC